MIVKDRRNDGCKTEKKWFVGNYRDGKEYDYEYVHNFAIIYFVRFENRNMF